MRKKTTELLAKGEFRLVQVTSNSREVLESIPREEQVHSELDSYGAHLPAEGALGVVWDAERDSLGFRFRDSEVPATKREVLRETASIFDPGITAPCLIMAEILMQKLRTLQLDWDEEMKRTEKLQWEDRLKELPNLRQVCISCCLQWPSQPPVCDLTHTDPEMKTEADSYLVAVTETENWLPDAANFSSWTQYKRTTAWMLRFMHNCQSSTEAGSTRQRQTGPLQAAELQEAEEVTVKSAQKETYVHEIQALKNEEQVQKSSLRIEQNSPRGLWPLARVTDSPERTTECERCGLSPRM